LVGHGAVAMSTKTKKSALPHGRCRAPILSFAAALRWRELPPNCLEIGGRPWRMSGSYGHVTDRRERRTHTHALLHMDTHTHTRPQKTREREIDRKIGRERERDRERGREGRVD